MTFEHLMRFSLKDIQTLLLRCGRCGATISHDLSKKISLYQCPTGGCPQVWRWDDPHDDINKIITGLNGYLNNLPDCLPAFDISFELKELQGTRPGKAVAD